MNFRRFWLENNDDADNFLRLKTKHVSTWPLPVQLSGYILIQPGLQKNANVKIDFRSL